MGSDPQFDLAVVRFHEYTARRCTKARAVGNFLGDVLQVGLVAGSSSRCAADLVPSTIHAAVLYVVKPFLPITTVTLIRLAIPGEQISHRMVNTAERFLARARQLDTEKPEHFLHLRMGVPVPIRAVWFRRRL